MSEQVYEVEQNTDFDHVTSDAIKSVMTYYATREKRFTSAICFSAYTKPKDINFSHQKKIIVDYLKRNQYDILRLQVTESIDRLEHSYETDRYSGSVRVGKRYGEGLRLSAAVAKRYGCCCPGCRKVHKRIVTYKEHDIVGDSYLIGCRFDQAKDKIEKYRVCSVCLQCERQVRRKMKRDKINTNCHDDVLLYLIEIASSVRNRKFYCRTIVMPRELRRIHNREQE